MCLSPINILNRSRRFKVGISQPVLSVPCGHCEKCQSRKSDDWFVRACAEWDRIQKYHGFVWFPTLTYRNEDLPVWRDDEYKFIAPTFDKSHFVAFRTKLRVYLKRHGYNFSGDKTIRYLYVTEYGDNYGRSHLHALIFVPGYVPYTLFKELVAKSWIYGMVMYSDSGDVVQSVKGLRYVMKYMHKEMKWYEKYHVDEYLQNLKYDAKFSVVAKLKLKAFRSRLPHHCQSMGFGKDFSISDKEFIEDSISAQRLGLCDNHSVTKFNYHVPLYYKRKFLYDFDKVNNIYTINPRGVHIKQASFNNLVDKLDKYYASLIYSDRIEKFCNDFFPDLPVSLNQYYKAYRFVKYHHIDSRDIAIYSLVYRSVALRKVDIDEFNKLDDGLFLRHQSENAYFYFCGNIDSSEPLFNDYRLNGAKESIQYFGFDNVGIYRYFHDAVCFIEAFEKLLGDRMNVALQRDYLNQSIQFAKLFHLI